MPIKYSGYKYYDEEEVQKRENVARKHGYKEGYTQALKDTVGRARVKPTKKQNTQTDPRSGNP